jgi:hypothetical protein
MVGSVRNMNKVKKVRAFLSHSIINLSFLQNMGNGKACQAAALSNSRFPQTLLNKLHVKFQDKHTKYTRQTPSSLLHIGFVNTVQTAVVNQVSHVSHKLYNEIFCKTLLTENTIF